MSNYVSRATHALHVGLRSQGKDPAECLTPTLERLYVLLVLTRGIHTNLADVHDAWAVARAHERPDHADLIPFEQLSAQVAARDRPFALAIQDAARQLAAVTTE